MSLRVLVGTLLRVVGVLLLVVVALVLHIPTRVGRHALRDVAAAVLPQAVPGRLTIRSIDEASIFGIRLSGVEYRDDHGDRLLDDATVTVIPTGRLIRALVSGAPFPPVVVHARRLWIRSPYFHPTRPDPNARQKRPSDRVTRIPLLTVTVDEVVSAIPSLELTGRGLLIDAGLALSAKETAVDLRRLDVALQPMGLGYERLQARANVGIREPLRLDAAVDLRGPALRCHLEARTEPDATLVATARPCDLAAFGLDRLLKRTPDNSLGVHAVIDEAVLRGPLRGPWDVRVAARANDQPVGVTGRLDANRQAVDVHLQSLSLDRVMASLPASDLDGTIHFEREVVPDGQHLVLDTTGLTAAVQEVPIPRVQLRARTERSMLHIEELLSRDIGLRAQGTVDLASRETWFDARAHFDVPDLAPLPWVQGRAAGRVSLDATAQGRGERVTLAVSGEFGGLRFDTISMRTARLDLNAQVTTPTTAVALDGDVAVTGLRVRGAVGPADVTAHVSGDPRGRLAAQVHARGEGLLAALGPAAPGTAYGPTDVRARVAVDLGDPNHLRVDVQDVAMSLRGAQATVRGSLALPRGERSRGELPTGNLAVATARHGALRVALGRNSVAVEARAFDVAWLRPLVPALASVHGVIDGRARVDPSNIAASAGTLRLTRGRVDPVGEFDASVEIAPEERAVAVRVTAHAARGADVRASVTVVPPRGASGAEAWLRNVRAGEVAVNLPELHTWTELFPLPGFVAANGRVNLRVLLQRERAGAPLGVTAYVEGRELTTGVRILNRVVPAVVPLHVRLLACTEVRRLDLDTMPVRLRLALGVDRHVEAPEAGDCAAEEPLLASSLVAFRGSLRGPWSTALRRAQAEVKSRGHRFTPATEALLRDTVADAHLHVGPIRRSEWPLRTVAIPTQSGPPIMVRPPNVPMDTTVNLTVDATGAVLGLGVQSDLEVSSSEVPQIGLVEPVLGRVHAEVRPADGDSLLGALNLTLNGLVELSPEAPRDTRGELALDVRVGTRGQDLLVRGLDALRWVRFDVDSRHIRLDRFTWARERGVEGEVKLHVVATSESESPVDAHVEIDRLRARVGSEEMPQHTAPIHVAVRGRVLDTGHNAWTVRTCVAATPTPESGAIAAADRDCDPMADASEARPDSLRAVLALPLAGRLRDVTPAVGRARLSLRSNRFRIAPFTPVIQGDTIASFDGYLDASLDWSAAEASAVRGRVELTRGSATIVSLGEPMRDLNLAIQARGDSLVLERVDLTLGRGTLRAEGDVDLRGLQRSLAGPVEPDASLVRVNLRARTDDLPLGAEGNTYGWIDGSMRYAMDFRRREANAQLTIESASVLVKEQSSRELQPLAEDPDVYIHGRTQLAPVAVAPGYPMTIGFELLTPVWLRRSDFALAIRARGSVHRDRAGWGVAGNIEHASTQNWVSIFGKRFMLDRLGVTFDGNVTVNPQLDIAAHHDSTSVGRLTVGVRGRLRQPVLEFGSVNYPTASQAEVLAMIIMGRRDTQGSSAQTGDLASQASAFVVELVRDLAIGTATTNLSQRFSFLPTLIVEPGERGRYGAGISLGPRFYLQATYGAAASALGSGSVASATSAQQLRVLLEIALSSVWSTAIFGTVGAQSGQIGGTGGGGVDLFWSP